MNRIDDPRLLFYLRHQELIDEWAAIRDDVRHAAIEFYESIALDLEAEAGHLETILLSCEATEATASLGSDDKRGSQATSLGWPSCSNGNGALHRSRRVTGLREFGSSWTLPGADTCLQQFATSCVPSVKHAGFRRRANTGLPTRQLREPKARSTGKT